MSNPLPTSPSLSEGGFYLQDEGGGSRVRPGMETGGAKAGGLPLGQQALLAILSELQNASGVEGSILVNSRGLPMAASLAASVNAQNLAAMAGTFGGSGLKVAEALGLGRPRMAILEGKSRLLIVNLFMGFTLAGILPKDANLGLAMVEMERAVERIQEVLALHPVEIQVDEAQVSRVVQQVSAKDFVRSLLEQLGGRE